MIRTFAGWYAVVLGAVLVSMPFLVPALADSTDPGIRARTVSLIVAGVLLSSGGVARLMRFPGRVASVYLGIGAGFSALLSVIPWMLAAEAGRWQLAAVMVAFALLVIASWSLWPSNS